MITTSGHHRTDEQSRTAKGKFVRSEESIRRDAEALRMRGRGETLQAISDQLGYGGRSNVIKAINRATQDVVGEAAEEYVRQQLDVLDMAKRKAIEVLERHHLTISHGHVVLVGRGPTEDDPTDHRTPILDDGPTLQAIQTLLKIEERRAKLLGLDAAVKVDATVHQVDPKDVELMQLISEQKARNAAQREQVEGT